MHLKPYHRTTVRALYGDVDSMRQAYYGNYLRWFEVGRAEYMRAHGLPYAEIESRGFYLPVSEVFCKYLEPVRYDELLYIEARPEQVRRASARFAYRLLNLDEHLMCHGYTLHVCLDNEGKIVRMPPFLTDILVSRQA
jgi:acyl-CoA thioester hydrolase